MQGKERIRGRRDKNEKAKREEKNIGKKYEGGRFRTKKKQERKEKRLRILEK